MNDEYEKLKPRVQVTLTNEDLEAFMKNSPMFSSLAGPPKGPTEAQRARARRAWIDKVVLYLFYLFLLLLCGGIFVFTTDFTAGAWSIVASFVGVVVRMGIWIGVFALAFVFFNAWTSTLRLLGFINTLASARAIRSLAKLRKHKSAPSAVIILWCLLTLASGAAWFFLGWSYGLPMILLFSVFYHVNEWDEDYLPPMVHLLAGSSPDSITLHESLLKVLSPLRVTSLLHTPVNSLMETGRPVLRHIFRTRLDEDWRHAAFLLTETAPIVVMDTRLATEPVIEEFIRMSSPDHIYKVLFVVDGSGNEAWLDRLPEAVRESVNAVMMRLNENSLRKVLEHMLEKKENLPSPTNTTRTIIEKRRLKASLRGEI